ncbi:MAG: hypothetical protein KDD22_07050 [Bdellovibrionales bacterium]|nr:hypothetical protein [Bdellovibrionales bacterium]
MKAILNILLVLSSVSFAATALAEESIVCKEVLFFAQTEQGEATFQPTGVSIEVVSDVTSPSGWTATISQNGQNQTMTDIKVTTEKAPQSGDEVSEIAATILPEVNLANVASMRVAVVGVEANQQDGAGMTIINLLNSNSEILGQLVQIGWGFGKCSQ